VIKAWPAAPELIILVLTSVYNFKFHSAWPPPCRLNEANASETSSLSANGGEPEPTDERPSRFGRSLLAAGVKADSKNWDHCRFHGPEVAASSSVTIPPMAPVPLSA
jgi:hypothetical protein